MKVSKSLLAVIAMVGTMGFSAVVSAMDFTVYGSLRAGYNQADSDDAMIHGDTEAALATANDLIDVAGAADADNSGDTTEAEALAYLQSEDGGGLSLEDAQEALDGLDGDAETDATDATIATAIEDAEAFVAYALMQSNDGHAAIHDANVIVDGIGKKAKADENPDSQLALGHGQFGSRIGFRGSEDLGNGAEAGAHWEVNVGGAGETESGRHANVWYSGAFGKITIGQQGNPYRNAANWDQSFWIGGNNRYGDGGSRLQGVRYDGEAGIFNFSVMATAQDDDSNAAAASTVHVFAAGTEGNNAYDCNAAGEITVANIGANGNDCVATSTISYDEVESETGIDSWIATGHLDMSVATINLGYRVDNNEAQAVGQAFDNWVISANGELDALTWYFAFEQNTDNANVKRDDALLAGAANEVLVAADNAVNNTANANVMAVADALSTTHDTSTIGLFVGYGISEVSTVYVEYETSSSDGLDFAGDKLDRDAYLLGFSRRMGPSTQFIAEYNSVDNNSKFAEDSSLLQAYLRVDF